MAQRHKIEERIKKKEAEIQELEAQLKEARVYVQALQDVLKLFPRQVQGGNDAAILRPGSQVAMAREIIVKHGAPMHINEIVSQMGLPLNRSSKTGLAGSISAYVRKGEIFTRPAPNTFGLVELASGAKGDPNPAGAAPPPEFGKEPSEDFDDDIPF